MSFDAKTEGYDLINMDGRLCLFTNMCLDRESIPEGLFCYDVKDSDQLDGSFAEVRALVEEKHWGTIISKEEIPLDGNGTYRPKDPVSFAGVYLTLKEYEDAPMEELELLVEE